MEQWGHCLSQRKGEVLHCNWQFVSRGPWSSGDIAYHREEVSRRNALLSCLQMQVGVPSLIARWRCHGCSSTRSSSS